MNSAHKEENYKWMVLWVVMIGTLMGALDSSIVNVSIPSIMADFGSSVNDIEWVITAYMLAFATLMPLTAWFRDRIGHKNLYIISLVVFTAGSLLCGMAWNLPSLVVARIIQALGGGAVTPTAMAMISDAFEPRERGKAIGYWGIGVIVGPAFGPTLGGFLTKNFGWRSIFLVNLPIGIIGFFLAMSLLKADKPHPSIRKPFDFWGFTFLSAFLVASLLGLSQGEIEGWGSAYIVTCAVVSFFGFIGFLLVESLIPNGIIDIALFKSPIFASCTLMSFVRSVALYGGTFLLPLFLEQNMGLDEIETGLILLPGALVIGLFMPIAGKISDAIGPRIPTLVGLLALAAFMYMYKTLDVNTSVWHVILPTLIRGFGLGLLIAPVSAAAMNSVPNNKSGMASSILNLAQQVGGSVGIALLGTVLTHRTHFHINVISSSAPSNTSSYYEAFHYLSSYIHTLGHTHGESSIISRILLAQHMGLSGSVMAFQDAFLVGAGVVMCAFIPAFLLPNKPTAHIGEAEMIGME